MSGGVLGIVGGLGPEATVFYYRLAIRLYREAYGASPRVVVYSLPLEDMCRAVKSGDLDSVAGLLYEALRALAGAGAGVAVIAANTPHIAWERARGEAGRLGLRLIGIHEPAALEASRRGLDRVGIIATSGTLKSGIYQRALESRGIEAVEPPSGVQSQLDGAIEALALGAEPRGAMDAVARAIQALASEGAEAAIIACTDISPHLDELGDTPIPLIDASTEHVKAAVELLGGLSSGP